MAPVQKLPESRNPDNFVCDRCGTPFLDSPLEVMVGYRCGHKLCLNCVPDGNAALHCWYQECEHLKPPIAGPRPTHNGKRAQEGGPTVEAMGAGGGPVFSATGNEVVIKKEVVEEQDCVKVEVSPSSTHPFTCFKCSSTFKTRGNLICHMVSHKRNKTIVKTE